MPSNSPIKAKAQAAQTKSGGWKKKIGSKVKGTLSLEESSVGGGGDKPGQEHSEGMVEKQLSEPSFSKVRKTPVHVEYG